MIPSHFLPMLVAKQSKIQAGAILSDKGTLLDSDIKTAQRFNKYFSAVFTAENTSTLPIPEPLKSQQELSSFCDLQFDVESVHNVLSKLRPDKAMGPDGLASMLLIETQELITYQNLSNLVLKQFIYSFSRHHITRQ